MVSMVLTIKSIELLCSASLWAVIYTRCGAAIFNKWLLQQFAFLALLVVDRLCSGTSIFVSWSIFKHSLEFCQGSALIRG